MAKKFYEVMIKAEWCKACGICIALCPQNVLVANHQGIAQVVNQEACIGCDSCVIHCPDFCFEVKELENDK